MPTKSQQTFSERKSVIPGPPIRFLLPAGASEGTSLALEKNRNNKNSSSKGTKSERPKGK
jgi:hypothetical protein